MKREGEGREVVDRRGEGEKGSEGSGAGGSHLSIMPTLAGHVLRHDSLLKKVTEGRHRERKSLDAMTREDADAHVYCRSGKK